MGDTALRSYFKLAFTNVTVSINHLNAKYMIHNGRVILFMISPAHAINSSVNRVAIYNSFISLLYLYRVINPSHIINFNL